MKTICIIAAFIMAWASSAKATTPDTAWTVTLPENQYVLGASFLLNDSVLSVTVAIVPEDGEDIDSAFTIYLNSYTGYPIDTVFLNEVFPTEFVMGDQFPDSTISYVLFDHYYDNQNNRIDEYRFLVWDYYLRTVVDTVNFPTNEPCLRPDTSRIRHMEFTPDGEKLFMIVDVIEDYDEYTGDPIYDDQLYVWNTSDWTIHRKDTFFLSDGLLRIMPNNRMYLTYDNNFYGRDNHCIIFRDIDTDTLLYYLCEDETTYYSRLFFPKTDTTKFINSVYDRTDYKRKIQVRNQSDFSIIKTIYNDTINENPVLLLHGSTYLLAKASSKIVDIKGQRVIFDLANEYVVYIIPKFPSILGYYGPKVLIASNNSQLIFDGFSRTLRMYNAKYTTTSAEEQGDEPRQMLYPNPANNYIEINIPPLERGSGAVSVFDVLGGKLIDSRLRGNDILVSSDGNIRIDISSLSPGVYFVRAGGCMYKFVKM